MNLTAALRHLLAAWEHARSACERTRDMVARAIARCLALMEVA